MRALDDVSLEVLGGEIHALLGENGAGKSTILKILNGVHAPTAGTIEVYGAPLTEHTPEAAKRAGIGMIFQEMSLVPTLTVGAEHLPQQRDESFARLHRRRERRSAARANYSRRSASTSIRWRSSAICRRASVS